MTKRVKSKKMDDQRVCPRCGATLRYRVDFDNKVSDYMYYGFLCDKCNTGGQIFKYNSNWSKGR